MVEQVSPDIYRIEIPLPKSPLKALNAYVLKGGARTLLVDTGWDLEECRSAMLSGLRELDVNLEETDIALTHFHADHFGLVGSLIREGTKVYMGEKDAAINGLIRLDSDERRQGLRRTFLSHGFPDAELQRAIENHPGIRYGGAASLDFTHLKDGDVIEVGSHSLTCIETPGHTPGHMCFYETKRKVLFAGDHILFDITPNITRWPELENSLHHYLLSLRKVYDLDVSLVLPGHRRIMQNHRGRISELEAHHERRLNEALRALQQGEKTAWDVAPHLSWSIACSSWDSFPPAQKWFAMGETIAHLAYLEARGDVVAREHEGRKLYALQ